MKKKNQVPDWNRDKSWDKIEQRLDEKKKRPVLWWWMSGLMIFGLVIGLVLLNQNKKVDLVDQLISESESELEEQLISESIDSSTEHTLIENELSDFKEKKIETNSDKFKNKNSNTESISQEQLIIIPRQNVENRNNGLSLADQQKRMVALAGVSIPINTGLLPKNSMIEKKLEFFEKHITDTIQKLSSRKSDLDIEKTLLFPQTLQIEISKSEPKISKSDLTWFAESGLSTGNRSFHGDTDYINRRGGTETYRFTNTSNVGIEKNLSEIFYWRVGINFQTFFEQYDAAASSTEIENVFKDSVTFYILNDGQRYYEPGIVESTTTYTRQLVRNNFLYRLSLPIEFGVKFNYKKSTIAISTGIKPTIYQYFSGTVLDENDLHLFDNQVINERYYSNDFDLGLISNISVRYPISNTTQIGLGLRGEIDDALKIRTDEPRSRYLMGGGYLGVYRKF